MMEIIFMSLILGAFFGMILGVIYKSTMYAQILWLCAKHKTPEKVGHDLFYIVPEDDYVLMANALMREQIRERETKKGSEPCKLIPIPPSLKEQEQWLRLMQVQNRDQQRP